MKIRKLVAATDVKADEMLEQGCSISAQEDYTSAIDCIQCAINVLAHAVQCDEDDVIAKESIANLAVVLLDLKSAHAPAGVGSALVDEAVALDEATI